MTIEKIIGSGGGCFKAGTQVQLEDGKTIAIELIKEGDSVLAFDEYNNIHLAKVTKLHIHKDPEPLLNVKFWNGEIVITPNHWVLNQYNAFVEIGTLTEHDAVVDGMGHLRPIISMTAVESESVYNLTVEPHHTFIADGIRVHNGGHRQRFAAVTGSGGGGKGGGGAARQAVEAGDTLQSKAKISIIDLIGEGKIGGLVNGAQSIFLNNTALLSEAGEFNFPATNFDSRDGSPNQEVIPGFSSIETPTSMSNIEFTTLSPKTFSITNLNVDRVRIIISIAALTSQDMTTGDISGSSVTYNFQISVDGGSYVPFGTDVTIKGKTKSKYQKSTVLTLPTATIGWTIKVIRVTADSTTAALQNKTYFDSYVEITDANLNYPNSALISVDLDPTTFSSVPSRGYLVNGLYIQVPNNITIDGDGKATGVYTGIWNGGFTTAISSNPAWILYDLLTSTRYGLGSYIGSAQVDKSMLYTIGKYCDELVDDGFGGKEARFTINTQLQTQAEAYKIISDITSVFRGMAYWNGGMVCFRQDSPATPTMIFNQANVVNGEFSYSSSSRRDRHSVVNVTWNDPDYNYKQRVEYVEDHDLVNSSMGIKKVDTVAFGCSSRGQAQRVGRWILYSEKYESNIITFNVGLDSSLLFPGEIIKICDSFRAGKRTGGRIVACSSTSATLDAPVTLSLGSGLTAVASVSIFIAMANGSFVERVLTQTAGTFTTLTWTTALTTLPLDNAVFVLSDEVVPMLARVVSIAQDGKHADLFTVSAVEHNPSKFGAIESGLVLQKPKTGIEQPYVTALSNLTLTESTYFIAPGVIGSKVHVSWEGQATLYNIYYRISKTSSQVLITLSASNVLTTSIAHGLTTGVPVRYYYSGTTISGLAANTTYYAVVLSATTFKLATTNANAIAATPVVITLGAITSGSTYYIASANPIVGNWIQQQINIPSFDIESLAQDDILDVKVSGLDLLGVWSTPITATLTIAGKSAPPKPVATFTALGLIRSIRLNWTYPADMDIDFDHVNIRWSATSNVEASATLLTSIRADNYLVSGLNFASTPYYFWIKTVDTSGNESLQSLYATASTLDEAGAMVTTLNGMLGSSALNTELGTRLSSASDSFDPFQTWYFTATVESWTAVNASLTWSSTGIITLTSTAANPQLISPAALSVVGSTYLIVKAKVNRLAGTTGWSGSLYYKTTGAWTLAKTIVMPYGLNTVGNSALLEFNMVDVTGWTSTTAANPITQIRLDIGSATASGDSFSIDWIGVGRNAPGSSSQALVAAQTSINGLNASYTVKIDANGYVAGYGLASETNTAGVTTSSFAIRADKFFISSPSGPSGGAPIVPFSVLTTPTTIDGTLFPAGVYINNAYITKITADKIDSRGLSIRDAAGNIIFASGTALDWNYIGGTGKPAANATKTLVYSQSTVPSSPNEGDVWYVNAALSGYTTGAIYMYKSAAWVRTADATVSQLGGSGANIVHPRYATFEEGVLPPFTTHASGTLSQDATAKYFGTKSLKIVTTGIGGYWFSPTKVNNITPNKKWILSCYVYSDTIIAAPVWASAGVRVGITTASAYYGTNYYDGTTTSTTLTIPAGTWTRIYGVLDLTADSNTTCDIRIDSHATGKNVWFDGIMLEAQVGDLKTPSVYQEPVNFQNTYTGDLNATRNVYRGTWVTATAYVVGDVVMDTLGYGWSCILVHTSSASFVTPTYPVTSNTYWTLSNARGPSSASFSIDNSAATFNKNAAGVISPSVGIVLTTTVQNVTSPTYQWQLNGVNIEGATASSYTVPTSAYASVVTNTYKCIVTGTIDGVAGSTLNDTITIPLLQDGVSVATVILSNENSTFPASVSGYAGITFTGGNCDVTAYIGTTQLTPTTIAPIATYIPAANVTLTTGNYAASYVEATGTLTCTKPLLTITAIDTALDVITIASNGFNFWSSIRYTYTGAGATIGGLVNNTNHYAIPYNSNSFYVTVSTASTSAGSFVVGKKYAFYVLGTTTQAQWNTITGVASSNHTYGEVFTCANAGVGMGTGTAFELADFSTSSLVAGNVYSIYDMDWNSGLVSTTSFTSGAKLTFMATAGSSAMLGLNTDPATNAHYNSIDYAIYVAGTTIYIFESGVNKATVGTYTSTDLFTILYNNDTVSYYKNGIRLYSTDVAKDLTLYVDSSLLYPNALIATSISNIGFSAYVGPAANTFTYDVLSTNLGTSVMDGTVSGSTFAIPAPTNITAETAYADVLITPIDAAKNPLATITKRINYSLSRAGVAGANGTSGDSVDIIFIRGSSLTAAPATPAASTGVPAGWSSTVAGIAAGINPMWSSTGYQTASTGNYTWQAPVKIEGANVAEVTVYTRGTPSTTPTGGSYTFGAVSPLTTVPTSTGATWASSVPSGTTPVYTSRAVVSAAAGYTSAVSITGWSTPVISLQNGDTGPTGPAGPQGLTGSAGTNGTNGASLFTWLKYADTPTTGMSDSPTGKIYMGVAYNKTVSTESTTYTDYTWSLIKGTDGIPGVAGTNTYTWVKYGTSAAGAGISDSPTGMTYIGLAFNKTTATESGTPGDYTWSLIQGPAGPQGPQGIQGVPWDVPQMTQANITTYIGPAAITSALIGSIALTGNYSFGAVTYPGMIMDANSIRVYDGNGYLRVRLGNLV